MMRRAKKPSNSRRHQSSLPPPKTARQLAFCVLDEFQPSTSRLNQLLDKHASRGNQEPPNRSLALELCYGIVRRQSTLDALIGHHVKRPRAQVEKRLWTLLRLGMYQLLFADGIPAHAAVDETVELARWIDEPRWTGFANGVLRSFERNLTDEYVTEPQAEAVAIADGRYRMLRQCYFRDPNVEFPAYFSKAFSFPEWLTRRWLREETPDGLVTRGFYFNSPAPFGLRVNSLRAARDSVIESLVEAGIEASAGLLESSIRLHTTARVSDLPGFESGQFTVQDESAIQAGLLLNPQPGEFVLDMCAAPGTKTTHLAELMQNEGRIVATDIKESRLSLIEQNCQRLGIDIVETVLISSDSSNSIPPGPFDAILVDAPCSNTGVLGKRPEARWRLTARDIDELAAIQKRLLSAAADRLKPGGRIVYSTCSIERDENRAVVDAVLSEIPTLQLAKEISHAPGKPGDGGYQALLTETGTAD